MSDTPEETARKQQLLEEIWELEKQIEQDLEAKGITRTPIMSEGNDSLFITRKGNK